jgi:hypothetical protein
VNLTPRTAFVWSQTPMAVDDPHFQPMIYTCPNSDGSFTGYNTRVTAENVLKTPPGKRVVVFQNMLQELFVTAGDKPPFYDNGIKLCQANVKVFFSNLRQLGVTALDAVVPDVEGAVNDWQVTPQVGAALLTAPGAKVFLEQAGYSGPRTGEALSAWVHDNRAQAQPVLMRYADKAIYAAIRPMVSLYGNVLVQKWSVGVPACAARVAALPGPGGDTPGLTFKSSFTQTEEVYGSKVPESWGYPNAEWPASRMVDIHLTRMLAAKASSGKPLLPWVAPKSYQGGDPNNPEDWHIPWANTPEYDRLLRGDLRHDGRPPHVLAARPGHGRR